MFVLLLSLPVGSCFCGEAQPLIFASWPSSFMLASIAGTLPLASLPPFLGLLFLLTPPAIELDFIPVIGQLDCLLVGYLFLRLFIWLFPLRENVTGIAAGGLTR